MENERSVEMQKVTASTENGISTETQPVVTPAPDSRPPKTKNGYCHDENTGICCANITTSKKVIRSLTWLSASLVVVSAVLIMIGCLVVVMPTLEVLAGIHSFFTIFVISVACFYVTWFFFPIGKPKSCGVRAKAILLSWQTIICTALVITIFVNLSLAWAITYGYTTDGNSQLQASRLGHVGPNGFKVFHHYPGAVDVSTEYKLAADSTYTPGATSGPIGTVEVRGLNPATEYHYRVLVDGVAVVEGIPLSTAPVEGSPGKFSFSFGSCFMSHAMYSGLTWPIGRSKMMKPFDRMAKKGAEFVVILGDMYYTDVPHFIGSSVPDFEVRARQVIRSLGSHPYRDWSARLPSYFMYDDHELVNNWDGADDLAVGERQRCLGPRCFSLRDIFNNGIDVFHRFFMNTNPTSHPSPDPDGRQVYYFNFTYADNDFFVMDTRAFRSPVDLPTTDPAKTMLGATQLAALKAWALVPTPGFKFILSPSPLITMTKTSDAWVQYPLEREAILDHLENNNISNVVFLSGDIHIPFAAELRPGLFEFGVSSIAGLANRFDMFKTPDLTLDTRLLWYEDRWFSFWGNPASNTAIVNVDTTSTPKTFTVQYFSHENEDTPSFSKTVEYRE